MKRWFNDMKNRQVIEIEFTPNSVVRNMDIPALFSESCTDMVEITKSEYRRQMFEYQKQNETNMTMTISR